VEWILITNDDGVDAVGLPALMRAMGAIAPVRAVVPNRERSWIGKAITRFDPVHVEVVERDGMQIHAASGYPADCTQLGVNALFPTPPRVVVSGINSGYNHGSAYLQSSGTVGAVLEAAIAGVDGVAFSTGSKRPWAEWRPWADTVASIPMWERLAEVAVSITRAVWDAAPSGIALSVNLPDDADVSTERRATTVARVGYDRLFREREDGVFVHAYGGGLEHRAPLAGTDVEAAAEGIISLSAVEGANTGEFPTDLRTSLGC
jgi:5'-nucleotidase